MVIDDDADLCIGVGVGVGVGKDSMFANIGPLLIEKSNIAISAALNHVLLRAKEHSESRSSNFLECVNIWHSEGGAVAEWSKALLKREKINENQKIPGLPPGLGTF